MAAGGGGEGSLFFLNTAYWWVEFKHILETERVSLCFKGFSS